MTEREMECQISMGKNAKNESAKSSIGLFSKKTNNDGDGKGNRSLNSIY